MLDIHPEGSENRFRSERFRLFKRIVQIVKSEKGVCNILDLGGTEEYWKTFARYFDFDNVKVYLLNLKLVETNHPSILALAGDARDLKEFPDHSFDIVHSNSVIEHVGRWGDMVLMANEVRRLAPRYFVQTPYFWFPIEPHARFAFFHWMPESWRYRILMKRGSGFWPQQTNLGDAVKLIQDAVLIDKQQMQFLFPDAKIVSEKFLGFTKSLIAIR
jgi:hypothetical protein